MSVLTRSQIVDTPLTLSLRIGLRPCCCHFCLSELAIHWLCITAARSLFNYRAYKTTNHWRSVDAHFDVLSMQHLLLSIIDFIMIWTCGLSFWPIATLPIGKAKCSNFLGLFAPTWLKLIYLAIRFIAPAIHLFINRYTQAAAHRPPMIYLQLQLLVKLYKEPGETLTHSVLLFLYSLIPPRFYCINCHQHLCSLSLWLPCRPNQSWNIWHSTQIPLLCAFQILNAHALLCIRFNIYRAIVIAVNWIIQVAIPV